MARGFRGEQTNTKEVSSSTRRPMRPVSTCGLAPAASAPPRIFLDPHVAVCIILVRVVHKPFNRPALVSSILRGLYAIRSNHHNALLILPPQPVVVPPSRRPILAPPNIIWRPWLFPPRFSQNTNQFQFGNLGPAPPRPTPRRHHHP